MSDRESRAPEAIQPIERLASPFVGFAKLEASGGILLFLCTVLALVWANSPWWESYHHFWDQPMTVGFGRILIAETRHFWIDDGLMAIFFFLVGLEIKREVLIGELSSLKRAAFPLVAAVGGSTVPALLYLLLNQSSGAQRGWGIPMATDIAFALGLLSLFGNRVPIGLKVFLTALAIVDDLGAVLVIAIFYTSQIRWVGLVAAALCLGAIALAGRLGIRSAGVYVLLALGVWAAVFASGIHATVAGVLVAFLVPVRAQRVPERFLEVAQKRLEELRGAALTRESMVGDRTQLDAITDLHEAAGDMRPPALALEAELHPTVSFLVLPLFALFNAGVTIDLPTFRSGLSHPVGLGVVVGLVLGKQIGVTLFSWLAVRSGRSTLPRGVTWPVLYGTACLAGIGFTMSLFISDLAFTDEALIGLAKVGILCASLIAAIWGTLVLARRLPASAE